MIGSFLTLGLSCARSKEHLTHGKTPASRIPLKIESIREIFGSYREGNFQNRSWPDAFLAMHQKLSREYPFTEWKSIDWNTLYERFYPQIEAAENTQDERAYYMALRGYVHSIPDRYVSITTKDEYRESSIGGGFGFSILPLEDGRLIVARIDRDSFAELAGIQWGAEILEWNGMSPSEALAQAPLIWSKHPPATKEYELFERCALLTRAPVDTEVSVMFRNPDAESIWVTRLKARRDMYKSLEDLTRQDRPSSDFEAPLETKLLKENIGYIKIYCHAATIAMPFPARAFQRALNRFLQAKVNGLILDLRGNAGGLDDLATTYAGHFTKDKIFFRKRIFFDHSQGEFVEQPDTNEFINPRSPYFGGPVVVLIHRNTRDNAQALAATLQGFPNIVTMGVTGTEGSWACTGGEITMPLGHIISYPIGKLVEESGKVLITAGGDKESRVEPDIRIPLTREGYNAFFNQGRDIVLEHAIEKILNWTN